MIPLMLRILRRKGRLLNDAVVAVEKRGRGALAAARFLLGNANAEVSAGLAKDWQRSSEVGMHDERSTFHIRAAKPTDGVLDYGSAEHVDKGKRFSRELRRGGRVRDAGWGAAFIIPTLCLNKNYGPNIHVKSALCLVI